MRTRCAAKPRTIEFYEQQTDCLLSFEPFANRALDEIIEQFTQARRNSRHRRHPGTQISIPTTNRALATLRRMLRLAHEWRQLDRVPKIRLLRGERNREFVLTREQESIYLEFAPELLCDAA